LDLWHQRLGHLGVRNLKLLQKENLVEGLKIEGNVEELEFCVGCAEGRQTRTPFYRAKDSKVVRAESPLVRIHFDVVGPMPATSFGGAKYFALFTDCFSRFSTIALLNNKGQLFDEFVKFKVRAERQLGGKVKIVRCDGGGENLSRKFREYLEKEGMVYELTCPYTPELNGVAERANRTVLESANAMLKHAGLPDEYWSYAVRHAVFLKNVVPTNAVKGVVPYEAWFGRKPNVSVLKVFGCPAYVHIAKQMRNKLAPKSFKCVYVGVPDEEGGFLCFDPDKEQHLASRDVQFDELFQTADRISGAAGVRTINMGTCGDMLSLYGFS